MEISGRVAKNSFMLIVSQIISKAVGLLFFIYASRYLGSAGFGQYSLILAVFYLVAVAPELGLGKVQQRAVSRNKAEADKYLSNVLFWRVTISVCLTALAWLLVGTLALPREVVLALRIVMASLVFYQIGYTFTEVLYGFERMEFAAYAAIALNVGTSVFGIWALVSGYRLVALALVWLAGGVVNLILTATFVTTRLFRPRFRFDPVFARGLLKESWPFALSGLVVTAYWRLGMLTLGLFKGDVAVGWYSVGYRFLDALLFVPEAFLVAAFPVFSQLYVSAPESLTDVARKSIRYLYLAALPIAAGTTVIAPRLISELIKRPDFGPSGLVLQIVIWAFVFYSLRLVLVNALNAGHREKAVSAMDVGALAGVAAANLALVPFFGVVAASGVTVAGEAFLFLAGYYYFRRHIGSIKIAGEMARPLPAVAVMVAFLLVSRGWRLLIDIPAGALIYVLVLVATRGLTYEDWFTLRKILRWEGAPGALVPDEFGMSTKESTKESSKDEDPKDPPAR